MSWVEVSLGLEPGGANWAEFRSQPNRNGSNGSDVVLFYSVLLMNATQPTQRQRRKSRDHWAGVAWRYPLYAVGPAEELLGYMISMVQ